MDTQLVDANALVAEMRRAARGLHREWSLRVVDRLPNSAELQTAMREMQGESAEAPSKLRLIRRWKLRRRGLDTALKLVDVFMEASTFGYELARDLQVAVRHSRHYYSQCGRVYDDPQSESLRIAQEWQAELMQASVAFDADVQSQQSRIQSISLYNQVLLSRRIDVLTFALALLTALGIVATLAVTLSHAGQ